jgi:hypothetical protein
MKHHRFIHIIPSYQAYIYAYIYIFNLSHFLKCILEGVKHFSIWWSFFFCVSIYNMSCMIYIIWYNIYNISYILQAGKNILQAGKDIVWELYKIDIKNTTLIKKEKKFGYTPKVVLFSPCIFFSIFAQVRSLVINEPFPEGLKEGLSVPSIPLVEVANDAKHHIVSSCPFFHTRIARE